MAGKGSAFKISLPVAPPGQNLHPRLEGDLYKFDFSHLAIFVIDDDSAVLESMRNVLTGWGAHVNAASSGSEVMQLIADGVEQPDIILCDYRLSGGENGIDVINRLRKAIGVAVPAIIITGDTASDRVKLAHDSGFPILYKPVAHGKLRALIGNLVRTSKMAGND